MRRACAALALAVTTACAAPAPAPVQAPSAPTPPPPARRAEARLALTVSPLGHHLDGYDAWESAPFAPLAGEGAGTASFYVRAPHGERPTAFDLLVDRRSFGEAASVGLHSLGLTPLAALAEAPADGYDRPIGNLPRRVGVRAGEAVALELAGRHAVVRLAAITAEALAIEVVAAAPGSRSLR